MSKPRFESTHASDREIKHSPSTLELASYYADLPSVIQRQNESRAINPVTQEMLDGFTINGLDDTAAGRPEARQIFQELSWPNR